MKTMKGFMIRGEWAPKPEYKLSEAEKKRHLSYRSNMVWKNPTWQVETDIPIPKLKSTEVLMKIAACGVCGSDIHMLMKNPDGYMFFAGEAGLPVVVGHEFAGEVVEIGKEVKTIKQGDLITVEEVQYCGICNPCRYGYYNSCKNMDQVGFDCPNNGAMAEYVIADEKFCWSLNSLRRIYKDETKILEAGSLVEPISVAYEGVITVPGGIQSGGHVAIFGTGPIGLAAMQILRTSGAALIFAFEPNKMRRDLAKKMGADYVYDPLKEAESAVEEVMELTEGNGIAMGVEAAGEYDKTVPVMEKMLGVAGKITLIGMGPSRPQIDPMTYHRTGGSIYGSLGHSGHGDFPSVINLMASGRIDMLPCITARYPLDKAEEGIVAAGAGKDAKVLILP